VIQREDIVVGLHRLFGLVVDSALSLPLPPLDPAGLTADEPIIEVALGVVPLAGEQFWQAPNETPFACWRAGEAVILDWPDARFFVTPERIVVDPADEAMAVVLLLHGVWSVLLSARGQESLHGCVFARGHAAVAVCGRSGSGKSTIGLALHDAGWRLVADDLVTFTAAGEAIPGPPFIRLTSDRWTNRVGEVDATGKLRCVVPAVSAPAPLAGIVVHSPNVAQLTVLTGGAAVDALLSNVYNDAVPYPGQAMRRFELALGLASSKPICAAPPRSLTLADVEAVLGLREGCGSRQNCPKEPWRFA
jgi:hypothetical protein